MPHSSKSQPATRYAHHDCPSDVIEDKQLTEEEKREVLNDWELDLNRKLDSENENMWADGEQSLDVHPEEQLRRVKAAQNKIN